MMPQCRGSTQRPQLAFEESPLPAASLYPASLVLVTGVTAVSG